MILRDWTDFHDGKEEGKVFFLKFYMPEQKDWQVEPVPEGDKGAFRYSLHLVEPEERWQYRNMTRYQMSYITGLDIYIIFDTHEVHPMTMIMFMARIVADYQASDSHTISPFRNPFYEKMETHPFSIN